MATSALSLARTSGYLADVGQCILQYVSTSIVRLNRCNGRLLFLNGAYEEIPAAGVDLANTALGANDTTYFVYAYMSSGTMTLEASATAYAQDATYGHMIKSGDATRTLVGMVRKTGGSFYDQANTRFVRTWFNDVGVRIGRQDSSAATFSAAPWVEVNSAYRSYCLTWAGEVLSGHGQVTVTYTLAGPPVYGNIGIDSATVPSAEVSGIDTSQGSGQYICANWILFGASPAEGYHYVANLSGADGSNTATNVAGYTGHWFTTDGRGH